MLHSQGKPWSHFLCTLPKPFLQRFAILLPLPFLVPDRVELNAGKFSTLSADDVAVIFREALLTGRTIVRTTEMEGATVETSLWTSVLA